MAMTKQQAAQYILRQLGAPIVDVELEAADVEQALDDAAAFLSPYYPKTVLLSVMTNGGVVDLSNQDLLAVVDVKVPPGSASPPGLTYGLGLGIDGVDCGDGSTFEILGPFDRNIVNVAILNTRLSEVEALISPGFKFVDGKLFLHQIPSGEVVVEALKALAGYEDIADEKYRMWTVRYATALIKIQIGAARSKFTYASSPVQINGSDLLSQGNDEKSRLEEELTSSPSGFFTVLR